MPKSWGENLVYARTWKIEWLKPSKLRDRVWVEFGNRGKCFRNMTSHLILQSYFGKVLNGFNSFIKYIYWTFFVLFCFVLFLLFKLFILFWGIHIHISILPQTHLPFRLPHNTEQSSMCYTIGPYWTFTMDLVVVKSC